MEATQGNQRPHEDSAQAFGCAKIFYKPRNVVSGEHRLLVTKICMMGIVWFLELRSANKA